RIHNIHPTSQILGDINSPVQTKSQVKHKGSSDSDFISYIHDQRRNNHLDFQLLAQGHRQEEGIDYTDVFAPVARIEAIRLFLVFASFIGFMVYQMDVKSAFLYGKIAEEVYDTQPRGFKDPDNPKKVYKVVKALYGLQQAPRTLYARLSTFLLKHGYRRGTIDKTLFIKKDSKDIMLV
nr:putative ribonuclease H-like domain-containing protein [Tanacetum cinerariifolium]